MQRQLVLAVQIAQVARAAGFLERLGQGLHPHVPTLDLVLFEEGVLGEGFQRAEEGDNRPLRIVVMVRPPLGMGQEIERQQFFDLVGIQHQLFEKSHIGLDAGQNGFEIGRSAPERRHLQGLVGAFELLPGLPVVKPVPGAVALGQVGQRMVERLLAPAHAQLDHPKQRGRRIERPRVEEVAAVAPGRAGHLIPGIALEPGATLAIDGEAIGLLGGLAAVRPEPDETGRPAAADHHKSRSHGRRRIAQVQG